MEDRYSLPPDVAAALDRARLQVEALAQTADELQIVLPDAVGSALRDGLREEAAPISRRLAEVKGLSNQMIRRLERLETDLLIERHARVDDLAAPRRPDHRQWKGINERLDRIERAIDPRADVVPLRARRGRLIVLRPCRQGQLEARAPPDLGVEPDLAAERVRELARDREAEPGAAAVRDERPEQALAILRRDPGPVSSTATHTVPFAWPSSSPILPPSGVARNAFASRLSTIWRTRSPSETITGRSFIVTVKSIDRARACSAKVW